ncbi:hypothetical protein ACVNS2_23825 [Paenibacillus caseinilyticus]|uniref:Uncharacterized protein n=1 Tax=Paenibacillus mucilaginosus K02 TaxID=997761 RepID=I0BMV2_9BACL|nr:hypothetical protein [Paenibacillus mucilaginosus]AFH63699.2 hypothetical protein B2K_23940 [Paenibacillus mucilaginosus K02]WFA19921.1 hypothetical protein ERY13_23125 [Paenibacillus mucilaginosus]
MKKWFRLRTSLPASTAALLLAAQLMAAAPAVHAAAAPAVTVTLPSFPVKINGLTIDPSKAQYPPIVYKDITYFPLTWDYTQTLGLPYTWSETEGLRITGNGNRYRVRPAADTGGSNRKTAYTAAPVTYPVTVNDKAIDTAAEEYPLLNFRNITYFPMTWRFMHDEFHMKLSWQAKDGFAVISPQRHYMYTIFSDDADYLYLNSGSQSYKVRKSLSELPVLLTEEENRKIYDQPVRVDQEVLPPAEFKMPASPSVERKSRTFYYGSQELLTLAPKDSGSQGFTETDAAGMVYTEASLDLGAGRSLLAVKETDSTKDMAADFFTYYRYFYVNADGKPQPLSGYTHWPVTGLQPNPDGSWWLASKAYKGSSISARNAFMTGELALLRPDGQSISLNEKLKVREIEVLSRKEDGSLTFRAYSRIFQDDNPAHGIYETDPAGNLTKLSEASGAAYVDTAGDLWVAGRELNQLTNLSKNVSRLWYDYEFPFAE